MIKSPTMSGLLGPPMFGNSFAPTPWAECVSLSARSGQLAPLPESIGQPRLKFHVCSRRFLHLAPLTSLAFQAPCSVMG